MGVPSFYRWLSEKYPKVVSNVIEDVSEGVDASQPNPNQQEFDNLYLDMNGLIHPCCHPEDKPQPSSEDEMIAAVFLYIDRIFNMVRPRRLLYMAIDGVAPRAKMNQQRSRRFRAAQEMEERRQKEDEIREAWAKEGRPLPPRKPDRWDHNVITVIFSDATVPGEGEHKIMQFIRVQRSQPGYPPNLKHVIYGMDADLIMLSLATHEPHFTIIRETVLFGKDKGCHTCGQKGHFAADCAGKAKQPETEFDETESCKDTPFQFLSISVLREYLAHELYVEDLPFPWDLERVIDDFVFLCFFVGNDFLPHLPSLEIREGALDELMKFYKQKLPSLGGYLTDAGVVNLPRADIIMDIVGSQEAEILRRRHRKEQRDKERQERQERDREAKQQRAGLKRSRSESNLADNDAKERKKKSRRSDISADMALGGVKPILPPKRVISVDANQGSSLAANLSAADALRAQLSSTVSAVAYGNSAPGQDAVVLPQPELAEDAANANPDIDNDVLDEEDIESVPEEIADVITAEARDEYTKQLKKAIEDMNRAPDSEDTLRFHEVGYKVVQLQFHVSDLSGLQDRYYKQKFNYSFQHNYKDIQEVARHYAQGLCWVLLYYYKGCQSWEWYYPYHYAPFASDLRNMDQFEFGLELGKPFSPFSQLMGVLPAASSHCLPEQYRNLMSSPTSPIIHFYPTDFKVDLNGKKWAWQAVVLLPFIDQTLLLTTLSKLRDSLKPEEKERDSVGVDYLFVNATHAVGIAMSAMYLKHGRGTDAELRSRLTVLDASKSAGIFGKIAPYADAALPASSVKLNLGAFSQILKHNRAISAVFRHPPFTDHKCDLLDGTILADPVLSQNDFASIANFRRYGGRSLMFNADESQNADGTPRKQMLSEGAIRLAQHSLPMDRRISYPPANDRRYTHTRYEDESSYSYSSRSDRGDSRYQYYDDRYSYTQQSNSYYQRYDDRYMAGYSSNRYHGHPSSYNTMQQPPYDYRQPSTRPSSYHGSESDDCRYQYQAQPLPVAYQSHNYDYRQPVRGPPSQPNNYRDQRNSSRNPNRPSGGR